MILSAFKHFLKTVKSMEILVFSCLQSNMIVASAISAKATAGVFIVGAKRTPIGTFGGKLKSLTATELGVVAASAALKSAGVDAKHVDHVVFGNVR
jgi:hypothetical protein